MAPARKGGAQAAAASSAGPGPAAALRAGRDRSLRGRAFYESLGSPRLILAPMVEGSEYCWRELSRQYGAQLCYSPMLHARLYAEAADDKGRDRFWSSMRARTEDKLIVQFCANDPAVLLKAASHVAPYCDAVDVNFGCPQGIARKGRYGAFLQEDMATVGALVSTLAQNLPVPVTAKIRILDSNAQTLAYAKHVLASGASWLAVHCRTREQKGQATGLGDWSVLRYLRDNLPPETVLLANGNVLYHEDIAACLAATGFDGVLVAESNLYNPAIFTPAAAGAEAQYPRVDAVLRDYIALLEDRDDRTSYSPVKGHIFKILKPFLAKHPDMRAVVGKCSLKAAREAGIAGLRDIADEVKRRIDAHLATHPETHAEGEEHWPRDENGYRQVPFYRCQPYYRPLPPATTSTKDARQLVDAPEPAAAPGTGTGTGASTGTGVGAGTGMGEAAATAAGTAAGAKPSDVGVQEVDDAERSLKRSIDQVDSEEICSAAAATGANAATGADEGSGAAGPTGDLPGALPDEAVGTEDGHRDRRVAVDV